MGQEKRIKILSPVDNFYEAKVLIEEGADEIYGGVFPSFFNNYRYFLSPNQRTFKEAQMDESELRKVLDLCKEKKVPFYLTINQVYFKYEQLPLIIRLAEMAIEDGVSAFIMGSLPLIINIRKMFPTFPIHLSTMGVALNHYTVEFYRRLNIKRFTLPRSLLINEIRDIIKNSPNTFFDAFIFVGKCPNVEGFCSLLHTNPDKIWPCEQDYSLLGSFKAVRVQKGWQGFYRSQSCGVCAISNLIKMGITTLKIVGRGSPTSFKLKNLQVVKKAIDISLQIKNTKERILKLKELYKERFGHDCNSYCCYFPEVGFGNLN